MYVSNFTSFQFLDIEVIGQDLGPEVVGQGQEIDIEGQGQKVAVERGQGHLPQIDFGGVNMEILMPTNFSKSKFQTMW